MNIHSQVQIEFPSLSVEYTILALGYECKYLFPLKSWNPTIYCLKMEVNAEQGTSKEPKLSHGLEDPDLMTQHNLGFHDSLVR